MALIEVTHIDVGSDLEGVRHGLTRKHHMGEDREGVFLAEGSDPEFASDLVVCRREAYPVAVQVSIHSRMVHHNPYRRAARRSAPMCGCRSPSDKTMLGGAG